jgi:hypothetical protein
MILSDAIIIDAEDARHLCDAIQHILWDKKYKKTLMPEQTAAYLKLKNLVEILESKKKILADMSYEIHDIKRTLHPEQD